MKVENYYLSDLFSTLYKKYKFRGSVFMLFMVFNISVSAQKPQKKTIKDNKKPQTNKYKLTCSIIPSEQGTFGYDILDHNRKMIHQLSVPGMPGNKGFRNKTDAAKVASLVIKKINNNQMPPTVSKLELDSLRIKF